MDAQALSIYGRDLGSQVARCLLAAALSVALLALALPPAAHAATFDLTGDCPGGVGDVAALISAINDANGNGEADTIVLASGCVYTLTAVDNGSGDNANGLPVITSELAIDGNGATIQRDNGAPDFRILRVGGSGNLTLDNLTVQHGAAANGAGLYNDGGALTLNGVTVKDNDAGTSGGGIYNYHYGNVTITDCTFSGNHAGSRGGGMYNDVDSTPTLTNVTFSGNHAGSDGGGMYNGLNSAPTLLNVTFSGNLADYGGGMFNFSGSSPRLANCILWGNTAGVMGGQIHNSIGASPTISYSDVQDSGGSGAGWNASLGTDGGGNIDADPLFMRAPDPGDGDWTTPGDNDYGDLRLQPSSPAIDAGDNAAVPPGVTTDLDGNPRIVNGTVDMGAYERQQGTLYVDADAVGGAGTGLSWTDAFTEVQSALAAGIYGDEIWVAEGVYRPDYDPGSGTHTGYVSATFVLTDGVALYGGFDPSVGADDFAERDWETHVTVFSGDLGGDDGTDAHGVVTDTARIVGANAQTVVMGSGVTETAVLDGFTVTAGNADGSGGDLWAPHRSGGGMYNHGGSPTLAHVTFSGNFAGSFGGGMFNWDGSAPTLVDVTFSGNQADYGGGMYNWDGSDPTLVDVTLSGNHARYYGGGMYNDYSTLTLTNVTFSGNHASYGGGMYNRNGSDPTLTNVTFNGNHATYGGGMYNDFLSDPTLTNVTFSGNLAASGGGMYNSTGSDPTLTNVTFNGNHANYGGGMYNLFSSPRLANCILWGNTAGVMGGQIYNSVGSPTISYSDVQDSGGSGAGWDSSLGTDGGGNIDADPLFVRAPDPGDGDWTTPGDNDYGDLRLQPSSPAIDAGDNAAVPPGVTTDLDGNPRIVNDTIDMGAYEAIIYSVYLPLVFHDHVVAPNLVVRDVLAASDGITVVIENQGNAPAVDDFWVDAYVDPHTLPTAVNQTWEVMGSQGLAWGVTVDVAPGEVLTLTVGGDYYVAAYSDVAWPLAAGTPVYAQVDSANAETDYGAVLEDHEIRGAPYDNVAGPVVSTAGDGVGEPDMELRIRPGGPDDLPRREQ